METVLYDYWRSSAAYRVRIALNLLGIGYRSVPVNLTTGEQRGEANLARNPQGLVPTLEIDGLRLTQSLAIVEYLDETRGAGWLPADAAGRARVRALAHAVAMEIHPVCNLSVARQAVEFSGGRIGVRDWMLAGVPGGLAAVERVLGDPAGGRFERGDARGLADICLRPQLYNARRWDVDLEPLPRIRAIEAACAALPAFAAAHPDAQPDLRPKAG
jgi:maleylacetoacetate isomerase